MLASECWNRCVQQGAEEFYGYGVGMNGIFLASRYDCTGCSACASACPKGCIQMLEDREGFLQPKINTKSCIKCHKCERVCPVLNPEDQSDGETKAYAVINKDEDIRAKSSSGGVFYALAKWTIDQGGVVFGARFNDQWEVVHDYAETVDGIYPFMGSKYVQSRVGNCYKQAKTFLDSGRWVLFSGTPCQLAGLRGYLKREYVRLIQVDIICYGVPSPGVWRNYLREHVKRNGDISHISFRNKRNGWKNSHFIISYKKNSAEEIDGLFMKGFSYKVYLRESCYECPFRSYHRNSDLTIADYWGVDKFCNEMFDNKGTSVVFVHSDLGLSVLDALSDQVKAAPQCKDNVVTFNPFMEHGHSRTDKRNRFFRIFRLTSSFQKSAFVINKDSLGTRALRKISKYFHRFSSTQR